MSKFAWGAVVYGPLFIAWLVLELSAVLWKGCPWPTLSSFSWDIESTWEWTQVVFLAGLAVLLVHIVFHWPK